MIEEVNQIIVIIMLLKDALFGVLGGFISYLFDYSKANRNKEEFVFRFSSLYINMALGGFIGYAIGNLLELDVFGRNALICFSGFSAYSILLIAESRFANWLFERITGATRKDYYDKRDDTNSIPKH